MVCVLRGHRLVDCWTWALEVGMVKALRDQGYDDSLRLDLWRKEWHGHWTALLHREHVYAYLGFVNPSHFLYTLFICTHLEHHVVL
jgi:hypothetical protein